MKTTLLITLVLLSAHLFAQSDTIHPSFKGGEDAFLSFIDSTLKYPEEALEMRIQGDVFISLYVNEDGSISDINIENGIGSGCNDEALRIIRLTNGMWIPGRVTDTTKRLKISIPIKFQIIYGRDINYLIGDPYKEGLGLMKIAKYSEAIQKFSQFLADFNSPSAYYARGLCYLEQEDYRNAITDFEQANTLGDPDAIIKLTEAYLKYGNKFLDQKKYPAAIGIYSKALEFSPNEINVLFNRGIAYYYIGEKEKACNDWQLIRTLGSNESNDFLKEYCNQ